MRNLSLVALVVALSTPGYAVAGGHGGGGSHSSSHSSPSSRSSGGYRPSTPSHSTPSHTTTHYPSTPSHTPSHATVPSHGTPHVVTHPSTPSRMPAHSTPVVHHNGNVVTSAHTTRIQQTTVRSRTVMRSDARVSRVVSGHAAVYQTHYVPMFHNRVVVYNNYYSRWGVAYRPWYRYGFHGGFYYPLYPCYDIHTHFYSPLVFWLWADSWDDYYYRTWYGSDYDGTYARELRTPFYRPGVYFPTTAMRDLALGVASMAVRDQINFRAGINNLTSSLESKLSLGLGRNVALGRNDIVVSHFQMLEAGVVLEGFVSADARQFPFKALLDLGNPDMNLNFVPAGSDTNPNDTQLLELRTLNERIEHYGGVVSTSEDPEPTPRRGD